MRIINDIKPEKTMTGKLTLFIFIFYAGISIGLANNSYFLSPEQLLKLKRDSKEGDSAASYRIYQHYAIGEGDEDESFKWLKRAAEQGSVEARLQYVYDCLADKRSCNEKQNEEYLWAVISESENRQDLIDAHVLLGDLYIDENPEKALGYYKYAAAEADLIGASKILEYYQKRGESFYEERYWLQVVIGLTKEGSAMRERLLKRRGILDKEIKDKAIQTLE